MEKQVFGNDLKLILTQFTNKHMQSNINDTALIVVMLNQCTYQQP